MIHSPEAESATLYMLRESWEQAVMRKQANSLPNPLLDDLNDRIAHDMLPMLVHLLQERHDCDIQLLMHTVKSIVVEHMFYENAVSQVQWQKMEPQRNTFVCRSLCVLRASCRRTRVFVSC